MPELLFSPPKGAPGQRLATLTGMFDGKTVPLNLDVRGGSWIENCPEGVGVRFRKAAGQPANVRSEVAYYGRPYWPNAGEWWRGGIIRLFKDPETGNWRARGQQHEGDDSPQVAVTDQGGRHLWAELRGGQSPFIGTNAPAGSQYTSTRDSVQDPPLIPYGDPLAVRIHQRTNPAGGDTLFDMWVAEATWETATVTSPWELTATMRGRRFAYASGTDGSYWKALAGLYGYPLVAWQSDLRIEMSGAATSDRLDTVLGWLVDEPPTPPPPPAGGPTQQQYDAVVQERDQALTALAAADAAFEASAARIAAARPLIDQAKQALG